MEYRFFCVLSPYRNTLVYSEDTFQNAANAFRKLKARALALGTDGEKDEAAMQPFRAAFKEALESDLNTSQAITCVYDVLKSALSAAAKRALLEEFDGVLCLDLLKEEKKQSALSAEEIEAAIAARAAAKKAKNYAEADRIRAELAAQGVLLTDTPNGTTYKIG